ncbi:MAG: GDP-mannose 4,6-dehydratase [Bryobacteraceae bacterium]|nr:GDP-mannose 4,6-dehydratase [Bryobacteraceae bacterium]
MKKAIITGVTGQDGSFLAELLLSKRYEVHGLIRRASTTNTERINHLFADPNDPDNRFFLHHGDLTDGGSLRRLLDRVQPDEVYNLGAQSHVRISFDQAEYTADVIAIGTLRLLEAVRDYSAWVGKQVKLYQAGSSEMFGAAPPPQTEQTAFYPRSPYAVAKVAAHWYVVNYREAYGIFACNGIFFNHESERRGETFVTRKITRALTRIKMGLQDTLVLGNLDAKRDWGYAGDYVEAMWRMLQGPEPGDYVVATGKAHTVRDFLDETAGHLGLDWRKHVQFDSQYLRPTEVNHLVGDASKMEKLFQWRPTLNFKQLVRVMTDYDLSLARKERLLADSDAQIHRSDMQLGTSR